MAGKSSRKSKRKSTSSATSRTLPKRKATSKRHTTTARAPKVASVKGKGKRSSDTRAKVGSSSKAAKRVGGRGDFGAPESDTVARRYASSATKRQDPGAQPGHSIGEGTRVSGVGGTSAGPGSSSGGDLDTDIIGVGTGGSGIAQSGGGSRKANADRVADRPSPKAPLKDQGDKLESPRRREKIPKQPKGDSLDHSGGDESQTDPGEGAANVTNQRRNDDSFAGEISLDEAAGADND